MPKLISEENTHTGCYERRYAVGPLRCTLFTMGAPPDRADPDREWAGALFEGDQMAAEETKSLRAAAVLDDLVRWSKETLVRPLAFICDEGDVDVILRRIESWARTKGQPR